MDSSMTLGKRLHQLLRWSEKYTKTDMVYLAHGGFWSSIGTFVTAFSSFILSLAFANLIPAAVYGTYKYAISIGSIFNAFTLTGLETAVTAAVARGKEGVLKQAAITNLWWSIPSSLAAVIGSVYYFAHANSTFGMALLCIAFLQPLTVSVNLGAAFLVGKKSFKELATFYTVDNLLPALALIGVMAVSKNALIIIAVYFVANLLTTAAMYVYVLWRFTPNDEKDDTAITYGKHLSAMNVLANVADNFDKILTFHFLGAAQLAMYSFALALPSQTKLITKPINSLIFPKFAARDDDELRQSMGQKTLRFFILGATMFVVYIIIAPVFFRFFYPQYLNAVFLSQIYAVSFLATAAVPMGTFLSSKQKVRAQYYINIISSIFQLVSAVVGMILAGLLGLILARVATRLVSACLAMLFYYLDKEASSI